MHPIFLAMALSLFSYMVNAETAAPYLLSEASIIRSVKFLPKPPTTDSVTFTRDKDAYYRGYALKGTKRWDIAVKDADNSNTQAIADRFSDAAGYVISEIETPYTYKIIQEIHYGAGLITKSAKNHYKRTRPFVYFKQKTCWPAGEDKLNKHASYPSGHTTLGWAVALVLSEINPDRAEELLVRGYEYGYSRVICGAHWQSDVDAGYITGSALVARLTADAEFQSWVEKAHKEALLHKGKMPLSTSP